MNICTLAFDEQPIIAQSTPSGTGALALIRMTGTGVFEIANRFISLASKKSIINLPTHTVHYASVVDKKNSIIDRVLITIMQGPKTFTAQDTIEISCHNNPFIIQSIIEQAITHGTRLAQEGEFTKRAFLNNKIDLVQAEAVNEVIHANSKYVLQQALSQLDGSFSQFIAMLEQELLQCLALSEASFEFLDEEMEFGTTIATVLEGITNKLIKIKESYNTQQHLREGVRVALIGSVNAGKSSLFNALLNKQRSIVTSTPGTTRDSIEAGVYRNNAYLTLVDTAGLRQTNDAIEQEGITRSHQEAQKADIILLVVDGSQKLSPQEYEIYQNLLNTYPNKIMLVSTKSDLPQKNVLKIEKSLCVSSTTKSNIDHLYQFIDQRISQLFTTETCPFLLSKRQFSLVHNLEQQVAQLTILAQGSIDYELLSFHLTEALTQLSELTGKTICKESMDAIFTKFCVGK